MLILLMHQLDLADEPPMVIPNSSFFASRVPVLAR
jgi:hypothetical protein